MWTAATCQQVKLLEKVHSKGSYTASVTDASLMNTLFVLDVEQRLRSVSTHGGQTTGIFSPRHVVHTQHEILVHKSCARAVFVAARDIWYSQEQPPRQLSQGI